MCTLYSVCAFLCCHDWLGVGCMCVGSHTHACVSMFDSAIVGVVVCVRAMRVLCCHDATALMCTPCKCVYVCVWRTLCRTLVNVHVCTVCVLAVVSFNDVSEGVW